MVLGRNRRAVLACALLLFGGAAASAQRGQPANALGSLEPGQWQLRDGEGGERAMCLTGNRKALLQVYHPGAPCEQVVMESSANALTVRYTCPGHGHGRTVLRVETPRLVSIETQGVADGQPFSEQFEGRRTGTCG
jgi:hypothetical protein